MSDDFDEPAFHSNEKDAKAIINGPATALIVVTIISLVIFICTMMFTAYLLFSGAHADMRQPGIGVSKRSAAHDSVELGTSHRRLPTVLVARCRQDEATRKPGMGQSGRDLGGNSLRGTVLSHWDPVRHLGLHRRGQAWGEGSIRLISDQ